MKDRKEGRWLRWLAGAVLLAIGAVLVVGGIRLLTLGGSAYYLAAGLACAGSGALLWRGDGRGLLLYAAMLLGTVVWAFWEVGTQFWQLLPRLAGPTVVGAVLALPWLRHRLTCASDAATRWGLGAAVLVAALSLLGTFLTVPVFDVSPGRVAVLAPASPGSAEWTDYGANLSGTRHSPATQITPANVAKLEQAWSFETGDTKAKRPEIKSISFMATPLMVDDKVVFCSPTGKVFALDADTGRQIWLRDPHANIGNAQMLNCRGVSFHMDTSATGLCARRIISMTVDGRLLASDLATGTPCPDFGKAGTVNLDEGLGDVDPFRSYTSSPPVIVGTTAILGAYVRDNYTKDDPSGVVRAFDVKSGKLLWAWDSGRPDNAPPLRPGENWTRGSVNAWTAFSADPKLGLVYVPTGNATPDHVGTHRSPMLERYASSIVALDVATGRVRWAFQTVHHDSWDYDIRQAPAEMNRIQNI